jgi:hypothetical protein
MLTVIFVSFKAPATSLTSFINDKISVTHGAVDNPMPL